MATIVEGIKNQNYTWRDKEYYRIYQRELYAKRYGETCVCQICGATTTLNHLRKHVKTKKCRSFTENNKESFKDRVERVEEMLKSMPNDLVLSLRSLD